LDKPGGVGEGIVQGKGRGRKTIELRWGFDLGRGCGNSDKTGWGVRVQKYLVRGEHVAYLRLLYFGVLQCVAERH
jgi:hypothetical protein